MARQLPNTLKKILVNKVTHKFREATEIVSAPMAQPGPKDVLVKNRFVPSCEENARFRQRAFDLFHITP